MSTKGNPEDWEIVRKWVDWTRGRVDADRPRTWTEFYDALDRLIADCAPPPPYEPSDEEVTLYCQWWWGDRPYTTEYDRQSARGALIGAHKAGVRVSLSPVGDEKP